MANFNNRALNVLFSAVTNEEFKKMSSTKIVKEAWTIFQATYEGTKAVKDSKLRRLTTSFEEIKIKEDESFNEFYAKLKDIVKLERCLDLYLRDFMPRSPQLKNQRILTKFL